MAFTDNSCKPCGYDRKIVESGGGRNWVRTEGVKEIL